MPWGPIVQHESPRLNVGKLRHRIDIVQVSSVQDSTGGFDLSSDVIYANVWASIEALAGMEKFAGKQFTSAVTHQIVIRYIGSAPSWQVTFNYVANSLVKDSNGNLQQAQNSGGLSGTIAPVWNLTFNGTTSDGNPGVTWKNIGVAPDRTGVVAAMQVWFQGRQWQIESVVNPDERNKMLILLCVEVNDSREQSPTIPGDLN